MSHTALRFTFAIGALALSVPLGGCGDYSADPLPPATTGGGGGGAVSTGGSMAGGGAAGSAAGGTTATGGGGGSGGRVEAPPASCTDVVACGGDVASVWFATSACLPVTGMADLTSFGIGCTMAPATGKLDVTGNWSFADGKISDNTTTTGDVVLEMEKQCLNISGTVSTCDRLGAPLSSVGFSELVCVDSTKTEGGCTCTGKVNQMGSTGLVSFNASQTGKYTTADNKLSIASGDKPEYDYCIQGEFMTVTLKTKNNIGQVNGTVVFQRQP